MTPAEIALADALLTQGLTYWAQFQAQKVAGTLTQADLDSAASKLDTDIATLEANIIASGAKKPT